MRNTNGRVFGGLLMRRGVEIAFATAYCFSGGRPHFVEVDEVEFVKGVDVGDLLELSSQVLYVDYHLGQAHIHVEVLAHVIRPEERSRHHTNTFSFTFTLDDGKTCATVLPGTAAESQRVVGACSTSMIRCLVAPFTLTLPLRV